MNLKINQADLRIIVNDLKQIKWPLLAATIAAGIFMTNTLPAKAEGETGT